MREIENLQRMLSEGRISRREFVTRATTLGLAAAIPSIILSEQARADEPKQGGRLRIGMGAGSTTDSLDPGLIEHMFTQVAMRGCMRNCLAEYTNEPDIIGELAESWEASPDAKVWVFKLRKDVEFHNGKTLDANDVVASIQHHVREGSQSAAKPIVEPIISVMADGDNVVFELQSGNADFPFTVYDYHVQIMPANPDGTADWQSGIGTGPYMLEDWEPGVRAKFKRNPNYWKADRAHFDEIEMLAINDVNARTNALTTGEIDVMDRVDLKTAHLLQRNKDLNIVEVTGTGHYTYPMHVNVAPFDNNDVRMALKLGIDRDALVKTILRGHGAPGNDHPIAPAQRFYNKDLEQRSYDPEKAKWHLKQAGLDSLDVDLSVADAAYAGAVDAGTLYKEHAAAAGININLIRESSDGYWSNVWLKKPFCACYWGGRQVEDQMFSTAYAAGQPWNDSHFNNPRFEELLVSARAELDEDTRRSMYYEMQQIVRDDGGVIVPMFYNYVSAASNNLQFLEGGWAADSDLDGYKCVERWWFS